MLLARAPLAGNSSPLYFLHEFRWTTSFVIACAAVDWSSCVPKRVVRRCDGQIPATYLQDLVLQLPGCDEHGRRHWITALRMPSLMRFKSMSHMQNCGQEGSQIRCGPKAGSVSGLHVLSLNFVHILDKAVNELEPVPQESHTHCREDCILDCR